MSKEEMETARKKLLRTCASYLFLMIEEYPEGPKESELRQLENAMSELAGRLSFMYALEDQEEK